MKDETVEQSLERIGEYMNRHMNRLKLDLLRSPEILLFDEKTSIALVIGYDKKGDVLKKTYIAEVIPVIPNPK